MRDFQLENSYIYLTDRSNIFEKESQVYDVQLAKSETSYSFC